MLGVREGRLMSGLTRDSSVEDTNDIWQQEMEAGFLRLVTDVHPLISEVVGASEILRIAQQKTYSS